MTNRAYRKFTVALIVALTLAACESDEERLKRLQLNQSLAALWELKWRQDAAANPSNRSYRDSLDRAQLRLNLARRDLHRFMEGR